MTTEPTTTSRVTLVGAFDNLSSLGVRLLDEASRLGHVVLRVFDDELIRLTTGATPKFPLAERIYVLESVRFVDRIEVLDPAVNPADPQAMYGPDPGQIMSSTTSAALITMAESLGVKLNVPTPDQLNHFPSPAPCPDNPVRSRKKIIVTGCFDWLHSGHIRFFEEVSESGDLYVVVGSDANIRLLKGVGKPMFPQAQRCYTAGAIRFVKQAMVSSGQGWLDAEPEVQRLRPDAYAVNEDGDVPEKRDFCAKLGIEYIVFNRLPKSGLEPRSSTALRGF